MLCEPCRTAKLGDVSAAADVLRGSVPAGSPQQENGRKQQGQLTISSAHLYPLSGPLHAAGVRSLVTN